MGRSIIIRLEMFMWHAMCDREVSKIVSLRWRCSRCNSTTTRPFSLNQPTNNSTSGLETIEYYQRGTLAIFCLNKSSSEGSICLP